MYVGSEIYFVVRMYLEVSCLEKVVWLEIQNRHPALDLLFVYHQQWETKSSNFKAF